MRAAGVSLALILLPVSPAMAAPDITNSGLGTLTLGMPAQQAADLGWIEPSPTPCNSGWQVARYRNGLFVGIWNDQVMLISVDSRRIATDRGIRPGDSVKRLKAKYPVKRRSTNIYTDGPIFGIKGQNLYFPAVKGKVAVLELTNGFRPNGTEYEC